MVYVPWFRQIPAPQLCNVPVLSTG
jgi:hypothetical protein